MDGDGEKKAEDRSETDASLQTERHKTDEELARRRDQANRDADEVVRIARQRADAVLETARPRTDQWAASADQAQVASERALADSTVTRERHAADATLTGERLEQQLALVGLLAREREATDIRLLRERVGADGALASRDGILALVSHDLRSFLATIALHAQLLRRLSEEDEGLEKARRSIQGIEKVTAQMARLVGDLVDVASIEAGKIILLTKRCDVGVLLRDAVEVVKPAAASARIELAADVPHGGLFANVDSDRFLQVLANLLGNALKFTPPGGRVTVRGERAGEWVRVIISDTGEGIPSEQLATIFDRFAQGRRRDRRGLGLGLYIARRIIEAQGGKIEVDSTVGQGSAFSFTVPGLE